MFDTMSVVNFTRPFLCNFFKIILVTVSNPGAFFGLR